MQSTSVSSSTSDPTLRYGWRKVSPDFLQCLNTPKWFVIFAFVGTALGNFVSTSILFVAPNSIERQFGISSSQIGGLSIAFNITCGVAGVFAGHMCKAHKPRWIAIGLVIMSVGAAIVSLPKFIMGRYHGNFSTDTEFCVQQNSTFEKSTPEENPSIYMGVLVFGYIVHGIGAPSLWALVPAHIEDVMDRNSSSFYIGIYQSILLALSPALAFVIGKPLLSEWVDLHQPHQVEPTNAQWVGAWWLSFLTGAGFLLLWTIPLSGYPKVFQGTNAIHLKKQQDVDFVEADECFDNNSKSLFTAARNLATNRLLILVNLSIAFELAAVIGLSTFFQKIVHVQFQFTEGDSSLIIGCLVIPGAAIGAFVGGYLVKRYDWNCKQIFRFSTVMALVSTLFTAVLLVGCGNGTSTVATTVSTSGTMSCHKGCNCTFDLYKPVCTEDKKMMFYSPCHAGCSKDQNVGNEYFNCSCFTSQVIKATEGRCRTDWCPLFPLFAVGLVVALLLIYMNNAPMLIISLRVVEAQQRSLALGVRQALLRFLGHVPGPIIFGVLIDASCSLWKKSNSDDTGNCLEYDDAYLRYYLFACTVGLKLLSFVSISVANKLYELPPEAKSQRKVTILDVIVNPSVVSNDQLEQETYVAH